MIFRIHMHEREPWEKEVNEPEDLCLTQQEPPPKGAGCIKGLELEGTYQAIPYGYFNKTSFECVNFEWSNFKDTQETVAIELENIRDTPFEELPIIMGHLNTESGRRALTERLQTGK